MSRGAVENVAVSLARNPVVGLALVAGAAWWLFGDAIRGALSRGVEAVNPASSENIVNRAVTEAGKALTGDQGFSLGSWFYDLLHKEYDPNAPATAEELERFQHLYGDQIR